MPDIRFEIEEHIATLSDSNKVWIKEINLVSWNGGSAKYDLRRWKADHKTYGRGLSMTKNELKRLKDVLNSLDI